MYFNDFKLGMGLQIPPAVIEKQKMLDFARTYDPRESEVIQQFNKLADKNMQMDA